MSDGKCEQVMRIGGGRKTFCATPVVAGQKHCHKHVKIHEHWDEYNDHGHDYGDEDIDVDVYCSDDTAGGDD